MGKTIRRLAVFAAAVLIVEGLAILFLTPAGLEKVFVVPLRLAGEKFRPDTNTYAVYYEIRREVAETDVVVVGADFSVAESYDVLGHFTRFVKQYNNFSDVLLPLSHRQAALAVNMLQQTDEERFLKRLDTLTEQDGLSPDCCDYIGEIFYVNTTLAETRKMSVGTYLTKDGAAEVSGIADACLSAGRSVFCAVDARMLDGGFREKLSAALPDKKILYVRMYYTKNCASPGTHDTLAFPFAGGLSGGEPSSYFVLDRRMEAFYRYYRFVAGLSGGERADPIDRRFTDCFFVIAGGTPARGVNGASEAGS